MKVASERLLYHLLTQFLRGFDHQGEWLGSPLLDTRLLPARADGVDEQDASWHPGARHAEPPQRIQEADTLHQEVLQRGQCQKTTAKTISSLSVPVPADVCRLPVAVVTTVPVSAETIQPAHRYATIKYSSRLGDCASSPDMRPVHCWNSAFSVTSLI
jgi:hypothetical protein